MYVREILNDETNSNFLRFIIQFQVQISNYLYNLILI